MERRAQELWRLGAMAVGLAVGVGSAVAAPPAPAGQPQGVGPRTRNAAIAALLSSGFSSVTELRKSGDVWVGQGVRHAVLVGFQVDGKGVHASPAKR